jgi:hypothetical protein
VHYSAHTPGFLQSLFRSQRQGTSDWKISYRYVLQALIQSSTQGMRSSSALHDRFKCYIPRRAKNLHTSHTHTSWCLQLGQFLSVPIPTRMSTQFCRPESIGEGNHRLFVSDEFKNADPDLVARINKVTRELNDIALELAHRAGWEVQGRKKRRTDGSDGSEEAQEHARPSLSTNSTSNSSTQSPASMPLPNHIANSDPSGSSTPVPTKDAVAVTTPPTSTLFGMEQKKITSVVSALMYVLPFRLLLNVEMT